MEVVDIPFDRTTEWLLERRIVGASYTKSLRTVHARLAAALAAERPAEAPVVAQLVPPGTERASLTYFDAKAVMQALLDAGLGEKTLFGGYSNAHTAQWADIVRRYEAGSIHLADAASAMAQAVGYELPALKKEAARAEKELLELVRRQGEYERLAAAAEERYVAACGKKGLGTDCSREEIGRRLRESRSLLRATFARVAALCQSETMGGAVEYYLAYVRHCLEAAAKLGADGGAKAAPPDALADGAGKAGKAVRQAV